MNRRFFTVAEVNALLPRLKIAARMVKEGSERLSVLSSKLFNGEKPESDTAVDMSYLAGIRVMMRGVESIGEMGGELKDLSTGLIDFPALRAGRHVLLCWRLGEDRVGYWHDPDAGFAGRAAIEDETEFERASGAAH